MSLFKNKKTSDSGEQLSPARKEMLKKIPFEEVEKTNPKIALYNEIVRHAYTYSREPINYNLSEDDLFKVYRCVVDDYPELFWLKDYSYNSTEILLNFRCLDKNGNIDIKQIERKRNELKKAAKIFTRGISKKTNPYKALLIIYRRLILTLDYDGVRLLNDSSTLNDVRNDDILRSLYSALVEHKVVCAGYAVAMQYLLQSVGISCATVVSENFNNSCHAFNALKIGKYCYYLDATWGDLSNTKSGTDNKDLINYDFVCVPYNEFIMTDEERVPYHIPSSQLYPGYEKFDCTVHEYFRQHDSYMTVYSEEKVVDIFVKTIKRYDSNSMGRFNIAIRCQNVSFRDYVISKITNPASYRRIAAKVEKECGKKYIKLTLPISKGIKEYIASTKTPTFYLYF